MSAEILFYLGAALVIGAGGIACIFGAITQVMGEDRGADE